MAGKKIKYYRLKKGLTSEELANKIGCTKAAISLYESDERDPGNEMLQKIADALDVSWIQLLSTENKKLEFEHISFRKKQKATKRDIELLTADIEKACADRISIMDMLGLVDKHSKIDYLSLKDNASYNALKIRKFLNIPQSGPIYSITNALEDAGIIVLTFECSDEIDGINGKVNGIPYIFFNSNIKTIERKRFTIIHETCHIFFDESEIDIEEKDLEKYINKVAGNVLIPNEDIYLIFGKTNRNLTVYLRDEVAKKYKVAPSCLINRLLETKVITEIYHKKFFIYLNKQYGRKNEPTLLDKRYDFEEPTLFTYQVYSALSKELISASKAAEYLNVPLYDVMQNMRVE